MDGYGVNIHGGCRRLWVVYSQPHCGTIVCALPLRTQRRGYTQAVR
jgi:hypothetical protein